MGPGADVSGSDDPELTAGHPVQGFWAVANAMAYLRVEKADALQLLGGIPEAIYDACATQGLSKLDEDTLERASHVVDLVGALRTLFVADEAGRSWVHGRNTDPPFDGQSPLAYIVDGPVDRLLNLRRYLEGWHQGWP